MSIREIKGYTHWTMEGDSTVGQWLALVRDKYNVLLEKCGKCRSNGR